MMSPSRFSSLLLILKFQTSKMRKSAAHRLEEARLIALNKNGLCLSVKGVNVKNKLEFECHRGHRWYTTYGTVKNGCWCIKCIRINQLDSGLKAACDIAKSRGGICTSTYYPYPKSPLAFKCDCGYTWSTTLSEIKRGKWCIRCGKKSMGKKLTLKDGLTQAQNLAKSKSGFCLSDAYINIETKMIWKCAEGHIWKSSLRNIKTGRWCASCHSSNSTESVVRSIFEELLGRPFPKSRPKWLKGIKGQMELDGYDGSALAWEYNGRQHYEKISFFDKAVSFEYRVANDEIKRKTVNSKGITLIEIPHTIKRSELPQWIFTKLQSLSIYPIKKWQDVNIVTGLSANINTLK